jgi:hypothetical protein
MNRMCCVLWMTAGAAVASSAGAGDQQPVGEPFEVFPWTCEAYPGNPGEVHQKKSILTIQNLYNTGPAYGTDPRVDGFVNVIVNIRLNTSSNSGPFWGLVEVLPTAYEGQGKWVGLFSANLPGRPATVNGVKTHITSVMVAHGIGVFEGLKIRFKHIVDSAAATPPVEPPPGCIWEGEYWKGEILTVN